MTKPSSNQSEVAAALQAINQEYQASQRGLTGLAAVARHQHITAQQERLARHFARLTAAVGNEQQAIALFVESLEATETKGAREEDRHAARSYPPR